MRIHSSSVELTVFSFCWQRLISFYGGSPETLPQQVNEDSETVLPSASSKDGQNRRDTVNMQRISTYITEMEDIKKKLVTISTRCQYLENKAKEKKKVKK